MYDYDVRYTPLISNANTAFLLLTNNNLRLCVYMAIFCLELHKMCNVGIALLLKWYFTKIHYIYATLKLKSNLNLLVSVNFYSVNCESKILNRMGAPACTVQLSLRWCHDVKTLWTVVWFVVFCNICHLLLPNKTALNVYICSYFSSALMKFFCVYAQ